MGQQIRIFIIAILLVVIWRFAQEGKLEVITDLFDNRTAVTVLFIGNSRTEQNNMPAMIRKIADSAHSSKRYVIYMDTPGGTSFEDHWNDPDIQDLLTRKKWDYVVLQGRSGEQLNDNSNTSFLSYGKLLADLASAHGAKPVLLVGWAYAENDPAFGGHPEFRSVMHDRIQMSYYRLSASTGAATVNVGQAWETLHRNYPQIPLYADTNHPSIYGSYLCALMFYHFFSHDDLGNATYTPQGISPEEARIIKNIAQ